MRYGLFGLALAALVFCARGCEQKGMDDRSQGGLAPAPGEAPLLLDEGPLLLEDGPGPEEPAGPMADNSRCHVCHINYVKEEIALVHARAEIGCARCHGESDAHIADESWASGGKGTAPDIMYPRARINPFCMTCHPKGKIDAKQHKPLFAGTGKQKYCTDCHGSHRLPQRKCKWK
jgi:hypothetical protein